MNDLNQPMTFKSEMEKVATYQMPTDASSWDEEVLKHLHDEHPDLAEDNFEVVFKKTDSKKGYGYGFVAMGKEGAVKIPIIIKEYQMFPLDVFLYEKQAAPLNSETVKEITSSTDLGRTIPRPEEPFAYVGPNITDRVYPGLYSVFRPGIGGRTSAYKTASANFGISEGDLNELTARLGGNKYVSLLADIGVTEDQAKSFKERLEKDASAVCAWAESPMKEILKKAAVATKLPEKNPDAIAPGQANPLVDALIARPNETAEGWGPITRYGEYRVQGLSGLDYQGEVYPTVVDFNLAKQDLMIFCGGMMVETKPFGAPAVNPPAPPSPHVEGYFGAAQAQISGMAITSKNDVAECCSGISAQKGNTGFFYVQKGSARIAFIPVKILSRSTMSETRHTSMLRENGENVNIDRNFMVTKMLVRDSFGRTYNVIVSPQSVNVQMVGDLVMMPSDTRFRSLPIELVKLKSDPPALTQPMAKTAVVRYLGSGSFSVESDWSSDWAKEGDVREKIASYLGDYYSKESVSKVLMEAEKKSKVSISSPKLIEKVASIDKYAGAEKIARDLTKIAAGLPDPALVDTVLSLQFINKDNVGRYISYLPHFEKIAGHLADLLIASRIGLGVDEYPVKTAMDNVMEVISDLRMLKGK